MKVFSSVSLFLVMLVSGLFLLNGCKKEAEAEVDFLFSYNVDGQAYEKGKVYTINGTAVSFENAQFYVGGITLHKASGDPVEIEDKYLLVKPNEAANYVGITDEGSINKVSYFVGVDPVSNKMSEMDFTNRPAGDPLGFQNPAMHWSWNTGYRFIRFDGMVDTDGDGTPETGMLFHIGNDPFLRTLEFTVNNELIDGKNEIEFKVDIAKFFTGIDLGTEYVTHTDDHLDLANKFIANLSEVITL